MGRFSCLSGWVSLALVLSQSMLRNWKPSCSAEIELEKAKLTDVASGAGCCILMWGQQWSVSAMLYRCISRPSNTRMCSNQIWNRPNALALTFRHSSGQSREGFHLHSAVSTSAPWLARLSFSAFASCRDKLVKWYNKRRFEPSLDQLDVGG